MTTGQGLAVPEERGIDFAQVLDDAQKKAKLLRSLVDQVGLSRKIGDSEHLEVEAWVTIARGYGYTPRIEWTRAVASGGSGWEARAEVLDATGRVVCSADSECGTDGDANWMDKPSFQQRSMAQTRAISKALRMCLSWVVVLAGYKATPAEEMDGAVPIGKAVPSQHICPVHKTAWFKKGRMTGYAHPIEGTDQWCSKDEPLPQTLPQPQDDYVPAPAESTPASGDLKSVGDLLNWAQKRYGIGRDKVAAAAGMSVDWLLKLATPRELMAVKGQVEALYGRK